MNILAALFLGSLLLGQLGGISLFPGVVVYVHDIFLLFFLGVISIRFLHKHPVTTPKLLLPIAGFVIVAIVSLLLNWSRFSPGELGFGSLYLVRWILYAGIYLIALQRTISEKFWLWGLYAVGIGFATMGMVQFFLYPDLRNLMYLGWDPHYYRLFSTLFDPNFMGLLLVLTLFIGFGLWSEKEKRSVLMMGQVLSFGALLLTYSRSSYLAFVAGVVTWAAIQKKWYILMGLVCFGVLVIALPRATEELQLTRMDTVWARIGNWQESIERISQSPLIGHGFDTLRYVEGRSPSGAFISKSAAGVDSGILFILATTGIVGLVAYGFLLFRMTRSAMQILKNKKQAVWGIVYITSFVALAVHSLFVNSMFYPWILLWFWILAGVMERKAR